MAAFKKVIQVFASL